jgi:hypothetical protein
VTTSEQARLREWMAEADRCGWTVTKHRRGGHLKWWRPDGTLGAVTGTSPSGGKRSLINMRATLRRAGLTGIL